MLLVRSLAILTPFQKSTRDRIASTLPSLAAKIRADRLQLAKLDLWASVLESDLERETSEFARVRHVALQAAAKSLNDPLGVKAVVDQVNTEGDGSQPIQVPKLSLPEERVENDESTYRFGTSPGELPIIIRRPSEEFATRPGFSHQSSASSLRSVDGNTLTQRPRLARQVSDSTTSSNRVRPVRVEEGDPSSTKAVGT